MPGFPPSPIRKIPCSWTNGRTKEGSRCLRIASSGLAPIAHRAVEHRGASTDNRGDSLQRTSTFSLPTRTTLTHRAGARCRHDTEEAAIGKSNIFFSINVGSPPFPRPNPTGRRPRNQSLTLHPALQATMAPGPQSPPPRGRRPGRTSTNREPETEPETWKCKCGVARCPAIYCHDLSVIPD